MVMLSEETQPSLPDDVIMDCIAPRVSRCNYPILSLVSKQLRSLVSSSPKIYMNRSLLECTEQCVYVLVENTETGISHWHSLNRGANRNMVRNRLVRILSLPPMPILGNYVVVGPKIFVMGGYYGYSDDGARTTLCIDCQTHTVRRVADMPFVLRENTSKVIDEKIYLVGRPAGGKPWRPMIVMVFDLLTETWEHGTKLLSEMDHNCFNILPREGRCPILKENVMGTDEIMNYQLWDYQHVMDEVLYKYDGNHLSTYDLKQRIWIALKGLETLPLGGRESESHLISCCKKLILFLVNRDDFNDEAEVWCAEITIEKRQEGEIWGNVESCDLFLQGCYRISRCLVVTL